MPNGVDELSITHPTPSQSQTISKFMPRGWIDFGRGRGQNIHFAYYIMFAYNSEIRTRTSQHHQHSSAKPETFTGTHSTHSSQSVTQSVRHSVFIHSNDVNERKQTSCTVLYYMLYVYNDITKLKIYLKNNLLRSFHEFNLFFLLAARSAQFNRVFFPPTSQIVIFPTLHPIQSDRNNTRKRMHALHYNKTREIQIWDVIGGCMVVAGAWVGWKEAVFRMTAMAKEIEEKLYQRTPAADNDVVKISLSQMVFSTNSWTILKPLSETHTHQHSIPFLIWE